MVRSRDVVYPPEGSGTSAVETWFNRLNQRLQALAMTSGNAWEPGGRDTPRPDMYQLYRAADRTSPPAPVIAQAGGTRGLKPIVRPPPDGAALRLDRGGLAASTSDAETQYGSEPGAGDRRAHCTHSDPAPGRVGQRPSVGAQGAAGEVRHHVDGVHPAARFLAQGEDPRLVRDVVRLRSEVEQHHAHGDADQVAMSGAEHGEADQHGGDGDGVDTPVAPRIGGAANQG